MEAPETQPGSAFWREAFALRGGATARHMPTYVAGRIAAFLQLERDRAALLGPRSDCGPS